MGVFAQFISGENIKSTKGILLLGALFLAAASGCDDKHPESSKVEKVPAGKVDQADPSPVERPPTDLQETNAEVLGKAQITVYAEGKKTVLDSRSPHFREMQLACEELIISSFSEFVSGDEIKNWPSSEAVRNKEWAIEVTYVRPLPQRKLGFARGLTKHVSVYQFLIPLTGELTSTRSGDDRFTALFPFEKVVLLGGKKEIVDWVSTNSCWVGTKKRVGTVKTLLKRFGMDVPLQAPSDQKGSNRARSEVCE